MEITLVQGSSTPMKPVLIWLCSYNTSYRKIILDILDIFLLHLVFPVFLDWICRTASNESFFLFVFEQHSQYFDSFRLPKFLFLYTFFGQMGFLWLQLELVFVAGCNLHDYKPIFVHELLWQYIEPCNAIYAFHHIVKIYFFYLVLLGDNYRFTIINNKMLS